MEKLNSVNKQYIRNAPVRTLSAEIKPRLAAHGYPMPDDAYLGTVIELMRERATTLEEFVIGCGYLYADPQEYEEETRRKNWKPESAAHLQVVVSALRNLPDFSAGSIEGVVRSAAEQLAVGTGKLIHPLRLAVSGTGKGPGLFEMMQLLGKGTCLRRIERAIQTLG